MNRQHRTILRAVLSSALLSLLLAACAVGPNYTKPREDLKPFHNATPVGAQPGVPLDHWWVGFNDPMLVTIIQRALDQNLDLAAALARVRQARAVAFGAGAQLLPTLDLDGSATAERQSLNGEIGSVAGSLPTFQRNVRDYTVGPAASWEIDLFGGLRRGAAAARAEVQAAQADQAGTRVTVVADAADAYFQIRGYQARLAITQNQIDTDEHLLRLVRARYEAGAAQGREIAQAEALLKQALASVPPLHIALEQQLNRLDVLMGAQPGTYAQELEAVREIPAIPTIPGDDHPSDVLRRRPDIIAAERRLAASNERIGAALCDYYPKVSLSGALGYDNVTGGHLFRANAFQALGTGAVRWRLFDFGKVDAEVAQARGANAEALAVYRQAVLRAAEDVENALVILAQTEIHVVQLRDQVQSLLRARDLSEQAYKAGSITLTDVLDADRQLLSVRDELEANQTGATRAAVGVFRALGGGWEVSGAN
jgi:NodT family efflux transporter outer membrane factor (OMF) lipoprotein